MLVYSVVMGMPDFDRTLKFSNMQDEQAGINSLNCYPASINAIETSWNKVKAAFAAATLAPVLA